MPSNRAGRFESAPTAARLFLDEVGDLPLAAQVKAAARACQTGEVERLGDDQTRRVDVRLVAATNVDLQDAIRAGPPRPICITVWPPAGGDPASARAPQRHPAARRGPRQVRDAIPPADQGFSVPGHAG